MDESITDQLSRYLVDVAASDPGKLPMAMVEVVQFSVMAAVVNSLWYGMVGMLEEWQEILEIG